MMKRSKTSFVHRLKDYSHRHKCSVDSASEEKKKYPDQEDCEE